MVKRLNIFLNRIKRALLYGLAMILRNIVPIHNGQVLCTSYTYKRYSCNPRYISEYILDNNIADFSLVWVLEKNVSTKNIDRRIEIVHPRTIKYLIKLYTSEFIINNSRFKKFDSFFKKKKNQKYIQTWHGAIALKKIEGDAISDLSAKYIVDAKNDSKMCDLILSDSDWFNNLIRSSFWYTGEILKKGIPRNDIFFDDIKISQSRTKVQKTYNITDNQLIVLYAPTFRNYDANDAFELNWGEVIAAFEKHYNRNVTILIRLHPNSLEKVNIDKYFCDSRIKDACRYNDMQELLCACDVLITDYSSSMFDFAIMKKPCFIYANDLELYKRGFYFDFKELPFRFSTDVETLLDNILHYSPDRYMAQVCKFINSLGLNDDGNASRNVVEWMMKKRIS